MGVPASMCESAASNGSSNGRREQERFPQPRCPLPSEPHDITFSSVEGDFQVCSCLPHGPPSLVRVISHLLSISGLPMACYV